MNNGSHELERFHQLIPYSKKKAWLAQTSPSPSTAAGSLLFIRILSSEKQRSTIPYRIHTHTHTTQKQSLYTKAHNDGEGHTKKCEAKRLHHRLHCVSACYHGGEWSHKRVCTFVLPIRSVHRLIPPTVGGKKPNQRRKTKKKRALMYTDREDQNTPKCSECSPLFYLKKEDGGRGVGKEETNHSH